MSAPCLKRIGGYRIDMNMRNKFGSGSCGVCFTRLSCFLKNRTGCQENPHRNTVHEWRSWQRRKYSLVRNSTTQKHCKGFWFHQRGYSWKWNCLHRQLADYGTMPSGESVELCKVNRTEHWKENPHHDSVHKGSVSSSSLQASKLHSPGYQAAKYPGEWKPYTSLHQA